MNKTIKIKYLFKKFSWDQLKKTCIEQNWRIPTIEELKNAQIDESMSYGLVWTIDKPTHDNEDGTRKVMFSLKTGNTVQVNRNFIENCVVIKEKVMICGAIRDKKERLEEISDGYEEARDYEFDEQLRKFILELGPVILAENDIQGFMDSFTFQEKDSWTIQQLDNEISDCQEDRFEREVDDSITDKIVDKS